MKYFAAIVGLLCVFLVHKPAGLHAEGAEGECNSSVASHINKKINKLLQKYPEKQFENLKLTLTFNEDYKKLSNAILKETELKPTDCDAAEEALESFRDYAVKYDDASGKLEKALEYLHGIDQDPQHSLQTKLDGLKLEKEIKAITQLDEVEKVLEKYNNFKAKPGEPEKSVSKVTKEKQPPIEEPPEEKAVAIKKKGKDNNESAYKHAFEQIMHIIMNVREISYGGSNDDDDDDDFY